jgi:glycosyltransferase involved in cell wall biosynthesis
MTSDRLRVAVNLMWCVPGDVGGTEQHAVRQLVGLCHVRPEVELTLIGSSTFFEAHGARFPGVAAVVAPDTGRSRSRRVLSEHTWLRSQTAGFDLVHHPGGTTPRGAHRPYVLTIHDLQYLTYPEYFSAVKRRYLDAMIAPSARGAAMIGVPSAYVRTSVLEHLGVPAERVHVVPHGFEPDLGAAVTPEDELRARLSLGSGKVIVYPAMTAPHKNHRFLLEVLEHHWSDPDLRLVLIGGTGLAEAEIVGLLAAAAPSLRDRVVRPGRVSDADRNGLLAMAEALVFPSRYEGFGAPVIEAMMLGTPVVCSDATCLPDIVGDAAVVLPLEHEAWASALDTVRARRDELVAAGHRRAAQFTIEASGAALGMVYDLAVGR